MDGRVPVDQPPAESDGLARLLSELRQWHLFRVAAAYAVASWLLVQIVATVGPAFDLSSSVLRGVILAATAGFFLTMGYMLFRPKTGHPGSIPTYLSSSARLTAAIFVLVIGVGAAAVAIRALGARDNVSIAVLPFADLSPQRDKAYFAEGVAEEILSTLAAEKGIKVLGRSSARLIERESDPRALRASLGVTHLLEGSTRTSGEKLRVNVRLIDTKDGSQVWEEEYNGALAEIFEVQDRIASAVVRRLKGTFFSQAARAANPASIDAYASYLAARAILRENRRESIARARDMARQIVETHPDYAPGHALYAETVILLSDGPYGYGGMPLEQARRIALPHAREAIRLAPDKSEGYAAIGLALPLKDSVQPYRKALALDPSRADVRLRLAIAYDLLKRIDEAFEHYRLAVETEPLSPAMINRYIQILGSSGRTEEALRVINQFEGRGGSRAQAWRFRGAVFAYAGDLSRAIAARKSALRLDPGLPYQHDWLVQKLHFLGFDAEARRHNPGVPRFIALFGADDREGLRSYLAGQGPAAWQENGIEYAIFSLARDRDWESIVRSYDRRPKELSEICALRPAISPLFGMAMIRVGRKKEGEQFLACAQRGIARLLGMKFRSPDDAPGELEMAQASLLALRNDEQAFDWLSKALGRGWLGQYYSSNLADWPQFGGLSSKPQYRAIQSRIDRKIAAERRETLAAIRKGASVDGL